MHRRLREKEEMEEQMLEEMKRKEQEMKDEMKRQKVCHVHHSFFMHKILHMFSQ